AHRVFLRKQDRVGSAVGQGTGNGAAAGQRARGQVHSVSKQQVVRGVVAGPVRGIARGRRVGRAAETSELGGVVTTPLGEPRASLHKWQQQVLHSAAVLPQGAGGTGQVTVAVVQVVRRDADLS